jgi:hypothetical protein
MALALLSGVLILSSLVLGFSNVGGKFDSESFECGRPFWFVPDQGYSGTEEHDACLHERRERFIIAGGLLIVGVVLLGGAAWSRSHRFAE